MTNGGWQKGCIGEFLDNDARCRHCIHTDDCAELSNLGRNEKMKKAKEIKEATTKELMNFSGLCEPLIKYIRRHWSWKGMKPNGFDAIQDSPDLCDGEAARIVAEENFDGLIDGTACTFSFPTKTSLPMVCYDYASQGRDPLNTLISACVAFGLIVGEERALRADTEKNRTQHLLEEISAGFQKREKETDDGQTRNQSPKGRKTQ